MNKTNRILRKMDNAVLNLFKGAAVTICCLIIAGAACRGRQEPVERDINEFESPFDTPENKYDSISYSHLPAA